MGKRFVLTADEDRPHRGSPPMKRKRDFVMLYAALAGFALFVALPVGCVSLLVINSDEEVHVSSPVSHLFPEGTRIIKEYDTHEFRDGTAVLEAYIPAEGRAAFVQALARRGFVKTPLIEKAQRAMRGDPEARRMLQVTNGLWHFIDETWEPSAGGYCENYTFMIYDFESGVFYYIESDS